MASDPLLMIMLLVLLILCLMASWGWLQFVKYPTHKHRVAAGRFTAWVFGFAAVLVGYLLLTLG